MAKVILKRRIGNRVANGHPWIFANEVEKIDGDAAPGTIVEVYYHDGKFTGKGYINQQSQIIVRLLTREKPVQVNDDFFLKKLKAKNRLHRKLPTGIW
jgi:23S rRNA (cytosine1962-C5)-methyltransferase